MINQTTPAPGQDRILSIDFFRGLTMFFLVCGYGQLFDKASPHPIVAFMGRQLDHADWAGLTAWDLIQPFFMFIVGVAMPFAFNRRWAKGESWGSTCRSAIRRSLLLLFLGWLIGSTETKSSYTNVLAQLSVTYLVAFLVMRKPVKWQLLLSFTLLIVSDLLYRIWPVAGFNQPFTADHNFGSWLDIALTGGLSEDRWVAFNALPTTAHTIWGVVAGMVLLKDWTPRKKIRTLLAAGLCALVAGYALGAYIPMIKRICTPSFIIASGGWALIGLALSYWLIDVLKFVKAGMFFVIVGMNPLFIYLFNHTGGRHVLEDLAKPVIYRLCSWISPAAVQVALVVTVSGMLWYIAYFLYKRKIYIRI